MGYTEIDVPAGAYIGFGNKPGQVVEGVITDYDPTGATDFGGGPCPALEIELTRTAHSFTKGEWTTYEAGETVQISCGQVQLKKKVRKAQPRIGDSIRIELADLIKVSNGTVKSFTVGIDRNAGNGSRANSATQSVPAEDPWANTPPPSAPSDSDDPPF